MVNYILEYEKNLHFNRHQMLPNNERIPEPLYICRSYNSLIDFMVSVPLYCPKITIYYLQNKSSYIRNCFLNYLINLPPELYIDDSAFQKHRSMPYMDEFRKVRAGFLDKFLGVRIMKEVSRR